MLVLFHRVFFFLLNSFHFLFFRTMLMFLQWKKNHLQDTRKVDCSAKVFICRTRRYIYSEPENGYIQKITYLDKDSWPMQFSFLNSFIILMKLKSFCIIRVDKALGKTQKHHLFVLVRRMWLLDTIVPNKGPSQIKASISFMTFFILYNIWISFRIPKYHILTIFLPHKFYFYNAGIGLLEQIQYLIKLHFQSLSNPLWWCFIFDIYKN